MKIYILIYRLTKSTGNIMESIAECHAILTLTWRNKPELPLMPSGAVS